jgi:hypothetical protein
VVARWAVVLLCLAGCDKLFGIIRVDEADANLGSGQDGSSQCPASYSISIAGSMTSYRYEAAETAWATAEQRCESDSDRRTHLVVLNDDEERKALVAVLLGRQLTKTYWIGLSDRRSEDQFVWVSSEGVGMPPRQNPPWPAGQPDNEDNAQDCVRIQGDEVGSSPGLFDDAECAGMFDYVCECDGYAADPVKF